MATFGWPSYLAVFVVMAVVGLVSCSGADRTATLKIGGPHGSFSLVITGSDSTISAFEQKIATSVPSGATNANVSTVDGDQHTEPSVCATDVTDNGVKYHVAVYSTLATITPALCTQIARSTGQ